MEMVNSRLVWKFSATSRLAIGVLLLAVAGWSQSLTTGAIAGTVKDATGAVVAGAKITATNNANNSAHSTTSQPNGGYTLTLLEAGTYMVTIEKSGFSTEKQGPIEVAVSTTVSVDAKLQVGSNTQVIEVTGQAPLIEPDNPNNTTTITSAQIDDLPNPGGNLVYYMKLAPGAAATGGSTNGLSGVEYTMDGMDDNDPFNNANNSGATNLLLGANDVSEVSVNLNAYAPDQGRLQSAQVNYLSKSGGNALHGDAMYQWNGRALDAYDFFSKSKAPVNGVAVAVPTKPFDNINNFAAAIGGPIIKNKLFYFFDIEGTRVDLPQSLTGTVPSPAFETYAEQQMTLGGYDTSGSFPNKQLPAEAAGVAGAYTANANGVNEEPFLAHLFSLYGNTAIGTVGTVQISQATTGESGCNLDPKFVSAANPLGVDPSFNPQNPNTGSSGANPVPSKDTGCANNITFNTHNVTPETLTNFRLDWNKNQNDTIWFSISSDRGLQATGTSVISPLFNQLSNQPELHGTLDWTHAFTPTVTNDVSAGFLWYSAIFDDATPGPMHAALDGLGAFSASGFSALGSTSFPQGRNVTQYQYIDNFTWIKGSHSFKFGENFRRELVGDADDERDFAGVSPSNFSELEYGVTASESQSFPVSPVQPVKDWSLDMYGEDTWQMTHNLTVIYGARLTHNSNAIDPQGLLGIVSDWDTFSHLQANGAAANNVAYNTLVTGSSSLWHKIPAIIWQPRLSLSYQPQKDTLVKGGFGMFSAVAASSSADSLQGGAPFDPTFNGGYNSANLGGNGSPAGCTNAVQEGAGVNPQCFVLMDPTSNFNAVAAGVAGNAAFRTNFKGGAFACGSPGANAAACIPIGSVTALPANGLTAPVAYQYSLGVQRQMGKDFSLNTNYVGTRSQHISYTVNPEAWQSLCQGCLSPFPFAANLTQGSSAIPAVLQDSRFTSFSQTRYDGHSRYDGLQITATKRPSHNFSFNVNYTWSHFLTTGTPWSETSGFNNALADTYEDSGSDLTHVVNSSYTYTLPFHASSHFLGILVNGWQASGETFFQTGSPVFVGAANVGANGSTWAGNLTGPNPAYQVSQNVYLRNDSITNITNNGSYQWINPYAFVSMWDSKTKLTGAPAGGACFVPTAGVDPGIAAGYAANAPTGTEGLDAAHCQFPAGTNTITLRGPRFNWTNFYMTKNIQLTERINLRFDIQSYNLFNHPNLGNPSISGVLPENSNTLSASEATGQISSLRGNSSLAPGGDNSPRAFAFQGKITF